ncbi:hypothetical protein HG530_007384 [Fusarium avenaceum]|nr:hypothetical protein HG530_007384 [Fusarium avenaceum]
MSLVRAGHVLLYPLGNIEDLWEIIPGRDLASVERRVREVCGNCWPSPSGTVERMTASRTMSLSGKQLRPFGLQDERASPSQRGRSSMMVGFDNGIKDVKGKHVRFLGAQKLLKDAQHRLKLVLRLDRLRGPGNNSRQKTGASWDVTSSLPESGDLVEWTPQLLVEEGRIARSTVADKSTNGLEMVVVEPRVAGVLLHDIGNEDKMGQDIVQQRNSTILDDNQNSHDTAHQEFVLLKLSRAGLFLNELEQVTEKILGKRLNVSTGKHGVAGIVSKEQDTLHSDGSIRVDDVVVRVQILDKGTQCHLPLLLGQLAPKSVEILDSINL